MVVVQSCNHHIRLLRHVRPLIDPTPLRTITTPCCEHYLWHALLRTHALTIVMRCCTSALPKNVQRLQHIQNSLGLCVYSRSATDSLQTFHCLPLTKRMTCKIATVISGDARRGLGAKPPPPKKMSLSPHRET